MEITTATPAEIDTEIARLMGSIRDQRNAIDRARKTIAMEHRFPAPDGSVNTRRIGQCQAIIGAATQVMERLEAQVVPLDAEYSRRDGWTRYFLVDNDNGHVHYDASDRRCSRTPATIHYWLTSESGKTAEEVIEQAGSAICTLCFPDAPVDSVRRPRGYHTPSELQRRAQAAERAAKRAAKETKRITNPDGSALTVPEGAFTETLRTVVAAERYVTDIMIDAQGFGRKLYAFQVEAIELILTALAAKRGTTMEAERDAMNRRYLAKCKREGITP
jgi:hypothetical protein